MTDPADGRHVAVHPGTTITLRLPACEDCGFSWQLTARPDAGVARYAGRSSTSSCTGRAGCVGGEAVEQFRFVAVHYGQTAVSLAYRGPGSTATTRRLTVHLVVIRTPRSPAGATLHVVRRGDTLFAIARAALGTRRTTPGVAALAARLYRDNREVIGRDRDLVLPGELLLVDRTGIR